MENNNIWGMASDTSSKTVAKIKTGVQKYLIFIVLLFNIALEVVVRLYKFGLHDTFTAEFFVNLIISIATSMLCYICFIPFGRNDEMKRSLNFKSISQLWQDLSSTIRLGHQREFEKFCIDRVEEEKREEKKFIIFNNTMLPFEEYEEKYEKLSKKEIKALHKNGEISDELYSALKKCLKVRVKPIISSIVLQGASKTKVNDAGRYNKSYALSKTLQRPLVMFAISFVLNSITTTFVGGGQGVILDIMLSIFSIVIASVCGYTTGASDFKYQEDRIKSRVLFLSLFCENHNIDIVKEQKINE